jgi:2-hydroxychromene-2-carboxylate isomerase
MCVFAFRITDFSSPWSFVGATQVRRIAKECHAQLELVPILLGALFKQIEGPNMPIQAMVDAKRKYMVADLERWCKYWGLERSVRFPDVFPIRSVLPLRVLIINP